MNRKLTKLLKSTYGNELPNRKNDFIQQIKADPTWQKLHPFSSFFELHPTIMPVSAFMTVAAVCAFIMIFTFKGQNSPKPEKPPQIISKMTVTTSQSTDNATTAEYVLADESFSVTTAIAETVVTSPQKTIYTAQKSDSTNGGGGTLSASQVTSLSDIYATTSTTSFTTTEIAHTAVTSIYRTELFRHDYTAAELNGDVTLQYGYPDNFLLRDQLKLKIVEESPELSDFLLESLNDLSDAEISIEFAKLQLSMTAPEIIEGVTTKLEYIAYEGKPWTICEVTVSKVHHFNCDSENGYRVINKGDKINIAMPGGYMALGEYIGLNPNDAQFDGWTEKQINSIVIYEAGSNQQEPKIGDSFAYFLENCKLDIPVENLYVRCGFNDMSQFTVNGRSFVSCNSNYPDYRFYKSDVNEDSIWEYFYDPDSDRCIAFRNDSILLSGYVSCYSVDSDGRLEYLDGFSTDDGFFPFYEPYGEEQVYVHNEKEVKGRYYQLKWTNEGVTLKYCFDDLLDSDDAYKTINFVIK